MGAFGQQFQQLSLQDKDAYLREFSPAFKGMEPKDQSAYLNEVHYGAAPAATEAPLSQRIGKGLKEAAMDVLGGPGSILGMAGPAGAGAGFQAAGELGAKAALAPTAVETVGYMGAGLLGPMGGYAASLGEELGQDPAAGLAHMAGVIGGGKLATKGLEYLPRDIGPTGLAIRHPMATKTLAGGVLGKVIGGPELVRAAEENAIEQVIRGERSLDELPDRLMPRYMSELKARANAYARRSVETGQPIETFKLPTGLKEAVEKTLEEKVKMQPIEPRAVLTEEELQTMSQQQRLTAAQKEAMQPKASMRGMAHAAGEHEEIWRPSARGEKRGTSKSYRIEPRLP